MIQILSLALVGMGVGWLAGLSVSPVIATVLSSLMGLAAGLIAGIRGVTQTDAKKESGRELAILDARPAAILVLGIAVAAPLGIMARSHNLFGSAQLQKQETTPAKSPKETNSASTPYTAGVLFGVTEDQCAKLDALSDHPNQEAFREVLLNSSDWGHLLETEVKDTDKLRELVEAICKP